MTRNNTIRTLSRLLFVACALALVAVLVHPPVIAYAADLLTHGHHLVTSLDSSTLTTAGMIGPVVALTPAKIQAASKPGTAQIRALRGVLYDTQPYVSGATVNLDFFGAVNADKSLSNLIGNGGTLPNGTAFVPRSICVDILNDASLAGASTEVGALDDIAKLVMSGRGFATIKLGSFLMPEIPISLMHGSGGAVGSMAASLTAPNAIQVGANGVQDGGFDITNSFIITPDQRVSVRLSWPAAVTLNLSPLQIRFMFIGDWQLPVQ